MEALRDLLESDEIVEEYNAAVERITELKTAEPKIEGAPFILVNEFDQASNLWIEENRERHKQPLAVESPLISLITPTTQTIGGMIANVKFAEDELIRRVVPDTTILAITCNFGKQVYPGWTMPVKSSTKTKQRQDKKKARRKQQGDGSQMNSQISFIIRATHEEYAIVDGVMWIPTGVPIFKIKVFRTGYTQIPGATPQNIDNIVARLQYLVDYLNRYLYPDGAQHMAHVVNINPIMYNYKFVVNIPPNHEFDIVELCNCAREYARNGIPAGEPVPTVLDDDASYGTKASIRFVTAAGGSDPLFLIFRSGKSNIQGGVTIDQIIRSCGYLLNIISRYHDRIFPRHKYPAELVKPNVHVDAEWL